MRLFWLFSMLLAAMFTAPAEARKDPDGKEVDFDKREFTCPLGGKKFMQDVGYFSFPLITMPDGSWLGDIEIGVQIPVCPDNGLVLIPDLEKSLSGEESDRILYADYSAAERAQLPALIADPEYAALKADGRYAQAYWLASKLGRPAADRFFMLQRATWATREPVLRKKLVARFVADAPALIDAYSGDDALKAFHRMYVVNALRELGRFDEALALLDKIEQGGPVLGQPDPDSIFGPEEPTAPMRLAIAQKDDGRFAAETLPDRMVNDICDSDSTMVLMYGPTSAATKAACKIMRDREARESAELEQEFEEVRQWGAKPKERDTKCAATPNEKRSRGLQRACEDAQDYRDQLASLDLLKQPETLATDCDSAPEQEHTGPLRYACQDLDSAVGDQMGQLLISDDAAYGLMCVFKDDPLDMGPPDRSEEANDGCRHAKFGRKLAAVEKLMADPVALDARCTAYGDGYDDEVLTSACFDRENALVEQNGRRLSEDKAAFDAECSRFRGKMKDGWITDGEKERTCRYAWELRTGRNSRFARDPLPEGEYASKMPGDPHSDIFSMRYKETKTNMLLQSVAHKRAEAIVAKAKADGTYPKRKPGDRF